MVEDRPPVVFGSESVGVSLCFLAPYDLRAPSPAATIAAGYAVGPLKGEMRAVAYCFDQFLQGLEELYEKPVGNWQFATLDGELILDLKREQLGAIEAKVAVRNFEPEFELSFRFGFDQSHLPPIIRDFRDQFRSVLR